MIGNNHNKVDKKILEALHQCFLTLLKSVLCWLLMPWFHIFSLSHQESGQIWNRIGDGLNMKHDIGDYLFIFYTAIYQVQKKITQVNFSKGFILDVWQGSEYTSKWWKVCFHFNISKPRTLMQKKVHGDHIPILFFFAKPLNWYKNLHKYTLLYSCLISVSLPLLLSFSMCKNTIFQLFFW